MSESTASTSPTATAPDAGDARPWLANPVVDVLVGCGALALPLLLLTDLASEHAASVVVVAAGALAVVVNGPHYAATWVRAWRLGGRARLVLQAATVVFVVLALVAHVQPALLPWLFTAYLTWSPWHYATQNHGIGLLLLARDGAPAAAQPTSAERRLLKLAHVGLAAAAMVATHAGAREPFLVRAGFPAEASLVAAVVAVVVALVVAVSVVVRARRRGAGRRGLALLVLSLSTSAMWFAVPAFLARGGALLYAGGAAALLHCAQYLWIAWFVEGRAAYDEGRAFDPVAWAGVVVAGGVLLFTAPAWLASRVFGYDLIISLLILQALVNLHHFVVDAFIWKLREPRVRALFSGHARAAAHRERVSNARAIAWSLPLLVLLLLGVADVVHLAGTRPDAPAELRERAAVLNENDSRVWVQDAQDALADGDLEGARASLGRALGLSPWNADAQAALLKLHVVRGRDEEAWTQWSHLPAGLQALPALKVIAAGAALRLTRFSDAEALARAALVALLDDEPLLAIEARGVLGSALLRQGKPGEARVVLKQALDDATALQGKDPLAQGSVLEVGLTLAEAHTALDQADPALVLLESVLSGATKTNRADAAFRALVARARIFVDRNDAREALSHYQRALRVARAAKDAAEHPVWRRDMAPRVAQAWLDYGALLAQSDAPMRARYACALLAREAAETMPAGEERDRLLKFIDEAAGFVIAVLPAADVEALRKDPDAAAKEALALSYPDP